MPTTAILGLQWGDEGKGKLVDSLCADMDLCVRFQGGGNAGHTVYPEGKKIVLHHLPTGVLHKGCVNLMAQGMVIDPARLLDEIAEVEARGYPLKGRLQISDRAAVTTPMHLSLDGLREAGADKVGTTKRGIGPTYADRYDRIGVRVADLLDAKALRDALSRAIAVRACQMGDSAPTVDSMLKPLLEQGRKLAPYVADTALILAEGIQEGRRVLFEGAQGAMLDVIQGTYPFVTSSHTLAGGIPAGCGLYLTVDDIIGVTKAYCTRVGEGPFPTELLDKSGEELRQKGGEFGATTGRPRRCGWIDLFALRYICRISGVTRLAITKLDVLSGFGDLKVGVGYEGWNEPGLPADIARFSALKPVYKTLPGWKDNISQVRAAGELPKTARAYLRFVEEFVGVPIGIISVGPEREAAFFTSGAPRG
ncbi:MAG: adenylosuccinate synthase [Planctomycetes bacterium]|nr:adenylosuccinate synthase [Planctomycetota bacterium]MCL4731541.1 adenylosuccinate synthase [Planctomycetota bacterium]